MIKKKINKIPKFKNYKEEAKYWDKHSLAPHWNDFKDVDLVVELSKPREETLVIRLQKELKEKMKRIASDKGINISTLARIFLTEKLQTVS